MEKKDIEQYVFLCTAESFLNETTKRVQSCDRYARKGGFFRDSEIAGIYHKLLDLKDDFKSLRSKWE